MMKRVLILLPVLVALLAVGCTAPVIPTPDVYNTGIDENSWARVPAGEFLMGQFDYRTVIDYDFEIMVTPVTNAQYARYLNEALAAGTIKIATADKVAPADDMEPYEVFGYDEGDVIGLYPGDEFLEKHHELEIIAGYYLHVPLNDPDGDLRLVFDGVDTFTVETGYENHPMTVVTWFGAKAYCEFYGGRLPTDTEWEKAARGTDGRPFPWGNELEDNNANFYNSGDPFEEYAGKQGITTPVGFYNGRTYDGYETLDSPSPYGLYDMAGNVWEWTDATILHYRVLRGGAKTEYERRLRVWTVESARPDYYSPNAGFRSVRVSD